MMNLLCMGRLTRGHVKMMDRKIPLGAFDVNKFQERKYTCLNVRHNVKHCQRHTSCSPALHWSCQRYYSGNDLDYFFFNKIIDGTVAYMESVHDWLGIGWCPTIVLAVIPLRVILAVLMKKYQVGSQVKLFEVRKITAQYQEDMTKEANSLAWQREHKYLETPREINKYIKYHVDNKKKELYIERGVSPVKSLLIGLMPLPLWVAISLGLRSKAGNPVSTLSFPLQWTVADASPISQELRTNGILWFQDLSATDPLHILPVTACLGFLLLNELRTLLMKPPIDKTPTHTSLQEVMGTVFNNSIRFWCIFSISIFWNAPAIIQYYWCLSSLIALITNFLMLHPKVEITFVNKDMRRYALDNKIIFKNNYAVMSQNLKAIFKKDTPEKNKKKL